MQLNTLNLLHMTVHQSVCFGLIAIILLLFYTAILIWIWFGLDVTDWIIFD